MEFPERFSNLPEYAFPRLRLLLDQYPAGKQVLNMSVGDPKHHFPKVHRVNTSVLRSSSNDLF